MAAWNLNLPTMNHNLKRSDKSADRVGRLNTQDHLNIHALSDSVVSQSNKELSSFPALFSLAHAGNAGLHTPAASTHKSPRMTELYVVSVDFRAEFSSPLMDHVIFDISRHIKHSLGVVEYHLKPFTAVETPLK